MKSRGESDVFVQICSGAGRSAHPFQSPFPGTRLEHSLWARTRLSLPRDGPRKRLWNGYARTVLALKLSAGVTFGSEHGGEAVDYVRCVGTTSPLTRRAIHLPWCGAWLSCGAHTGVRVRQFGATVRESVVVGVGCRCSGGGCTKVARRCTGGASHWCQRRCPSLERSRASA